MIKAIESTSFEEWYQPEIMCSKCKVSFMYSAYSYDDKIKYPAYPSYCPNCGVKFEAIQNSDNAIIFYKFYKEEDN